MNGLLEATKHSLGILPENGFGALALVGKRRFSLRESGRVHDAGYIEFEKRLTLAIEFRLDVPVRRLDRIASRGYGVGHHRFPEVGVGNVYRGAVLCDDRVCKLEL